MMKSSFTLTRQRHQRSSATSMANIHPIFSTQIWVCAMLHISSSPLPAMPVQLFLLMTFYGNLCVFSMFYFISFITCKANTAMC